MSRRRLRRRAEKVRRHDLPGTSGAEVPRVVVREAVRVERLAYSRAQAAAALGISRSTFVRRVLPVVDTIETGWGTRLVPVDEIERFAAERRWKARAAPGPPSKPGRKAGLPGEIIGRIRHEHANGMSLGEIARGLNAESVQTSQGGRQWWPSTVRAVLRRAT